MILTMHGISSMMASGGGGGQTVIGGREYRVVTMPDGNVWLAENLDYKFDGCIIGTYDWTAWDARAKYYNNDESTYGVNGNKYGLLYNWKAVKVLNDNRATLCPGWHVPTQQEWDNLVASVGTNSGTKLKTTTYWASGATGTDDYGFSVPPGGQWYSSFQSINTLARYWTSTEDEEGLAYARCFGSGTDVTATYAATTYGYSLRLVKDQ